MTNLLKDKVVVVTGGAGLLGREFARAIVAEGGTAVIADINEQAAVKAAAEIGREFNSRQVSSRRLDIVSVDSLERLIGDLKREYGRIDALVNNAYPRNKNYGRKFEQVTYDDFCENVNMHLGGYFLATQRFALFFAGQGRGNIINIASIYGVVAPRFEVYDGTEMTMPVEYAAIKSALIHLTKYVARYYQGKDLRINALSPGGIRAGQPEKFLDSYKKYCSTKGMLDNTDLTGSLVYLLSDLSKHVNGQNIVVDDGFTL